MSNTLLCSILKKSFFDSWFIYYQKPPLSPIAPPDNIGQMFADSIIGGRGGGQGSHGIYIGGQG